MFVEMRSKQIRVSCKQQQDKTKMASNISKLRSMKCLKFWSEKIKVNIL